MTLIEFERRGEERRGEERRGEERRAEERRGDVGREDYTFPFHERHLFVVIHQRG